MTHTTSSEQHTSLSQSLYKELEGLKIRIAFAEIEEDEEESLAVPTSAGEQEYNELAQHRTMRRIHQELDKRSRQYFVRKALPRALQVFAGVVLFFFLSLTVATAASHSVRVKILTFIIRMEEEYTELSLENTNEEYFDVPVDWKGSYFISCIPDGFKFVEIDQNLNIAYFYSHDGRQLEFNESGESNYTNIDTEASTMSELFIHGAKGLLVKKEKQYILHGLKIIVSLLFDMMVASKKQYV